MAARPSKPGGTADLPPPIKSPTTVVGETGSFW
jgi:hypothetical protein